VPKEGTQCATAWHKKTFTYVPREGTKDTAGFQLNPMKHKIVIEIPPYYIDTLGMTIHKSSGNDCFNIVVRIDLSCWER
jgi:hypothetical protein